MNFRSLSRQSIALIIGLFASVFVAEASTYSPEDIENYFFRYIAGGRVSNEIQFTISAGGDFSTTTRSDDEEYTSYVSLFAPPQSLLQEMTLEVGKRFVFIHETTHAQIIPYFQLHGREKKTLEQWSAGALLFIANESAADVRALIEIWKKDGADAGSSLAGALIRFRDTSIEQRNTQPRKDFHHQTQFALRVALDTLASSSEDSMKVIDSFSLAIHIAQRTAPQSLHAILSDLKNTQRADEIIQSPEVVVALREIDDGFKGAKEAYQSGKYPLQLVVHGRPLLLSALQNNGQNLMVEK